EFHSIGIATVVLSARSAGICEEERSRRRQNKAGREVRDERAARSADDRRSVAHDQGSPPGFRTEGGGFIQRSPSKADLGVGSIDRGAGASFDRRIRRIEYPTEREKSEKAL